VENRGQEFIGYTSFKEDGVDQLDALVTYLKNEAEAKMEEELEDDIPKPRKLIEVDDDNSPVDRPKRKKEKYIAPEFMIIIDDLSSELKSKHLVSLLKMNRHFQMKCVVSSQYPLDLLPEARKNMDTVILFKGHTEQKLETIYKDLDIGLPFELFVKLYKNATREKYSFFYIDCRNDVYKKNFTHVYHIPDLE
jgi:hypothetical protein